MKMTISTPKILAVVNAEEVQRIIVHMEHVRSDMSPFSDSWTTHVRIFLLKDPKCLYNVQIGVFHDDDGDNDGQATKILNN